MALLEDVRWYLARGESVRADGILASLDLLAGREGGSHLGNSVRANIAMITERFEQNRKWLMFGRPEADGETGEIFRVLRYVSIDGEFANVDADEYEFMVSSCGGPYLTRVDFDRLRAQFLRGEREREEAGLYRRRDKPAVRPSNVSPEATPQTNPGAAKDSSNGPRRRAVLAIGALVILIAVLTWVFLRARRA